MTENGGAIFTVGTKFAGTVTRETEDVPFSQIYDHVTPAELSRFENAGYEEEDEQERIRILTMKPRGGPRKDAWAEDALPKTPKYKTPGLGSGAYSAFRREGEPKRHSRPVRWRKHPVPAAPGGPVPSFNGPQPTGEADTEPEASTREQTEDLAEKRLDFQGKTGVYSMVSVSGLGPRIPDSETEMDTLELTPALIDEIPDEPRPKRRRLEQEDLSDSASFETAPSPRQPRHSGSDDNERNDLLYQFTASPKEPRPPGNQESERLNLLDPFAAKTHSKRARSHCTSSQDSVLSTMHYGPAAKKPGPQRATTK